MLWVSSPPARATLSKLPIFGYQIKGPVVTLIGHSWVTPLFTTVVAAARHGRQIESASECVAAAAPWEINY